MRKMRSSIRGVPLLILAAILIVVPLLGVACSDDGNKAQFSASPESGLSPLTVQFTDQSEGDIVSWAWDFDNDGVTDSTDQNPSHTFIGSDLMTQVYTVVLTVTFADDSTDQVETTITATPVDYPEMNLVFSYAMATSQVEAQHGEKFAELLELYTGGAVQVVIHGGGTLFNYGEDWQAVKDGSMVDFIWTHPYFLSMLNINMNPYSAYQFQVTTVEQGMLMNEDGRVNQIVDSILADSEVKLLGFAPSVILSCTMSKNTELNSYEDFDGLRFGSLYPGLLDPFHEYFGLTEVYVGGEGEITGLVNDMYDFSGTSVPHAVDAGLIDYLNHALLAEVYAPMVALMNMDTWDSLGDDLQSLINDVIWPEVLQFAADTTVDSLKEYVKIMVEELDTVHILDPAQGLAYMDLVMASEGNAGDRLREMHDEMMPEILDIIEEFRAADPQFSPEVIEIMEYAGIEY
ncbi:PKD domain-containing protein [Chloroflexota bacterium]